MTTLAIESSGPQGSVAVLRDGSLLFDARFECPRGRGTALFEHLEQAMHVAGKPDLVVVGTGPGSYNGLRASISAAWGIATACGAKLCGGSSLLGYDANEYFAIGDARADQVFIAHVKEARFLRPPELLPRLELRAHLAPRLPVFSSAALQDLPEATLQAPSAAILALRNFTDSHPRPIYLKPPHITQAKTK